MDQSPEYPSISASQSPIEPSPASSPAASPELDDADLQAEYRREYLKQLRQRACPGCGETDAIY